MAQKHLSFVDAAKATVLGGAIFLIPGFLAVFVLGKIFGLLRSLALAVGPKLGIESTLGGVLLDVLAIALIILVCFLGGLIARQATAQRMRTKLDQILLASFPGYAFVKGLSENMQQSQEMASSFVPVLVDLGDQWQVAFETDRTLGGFAAIYLPGAPNPWSGSVVFMRTERVKKLPVSVNEALTINRTLGRGSEALAAELRASRGAGQS